MTNGIFERSEYRAYARATTMMSTQSATDFEWSVKLIGDPFFGIGIASGLTRGSIICNNDQEAIILDSDPSSIDIRCRFTVIHTGLKKLQTEDVIHFKFQPGRKKFVIEWVSNINSS